MHGEMVSVKASIEQIQSFSVHADSNELIHWMKTASVKPRQVFVVHGEAGVAESFADRVHNEVGVPSKAPSLGERIVL